MKCPFKLPVKKVGPFLTKDEADYIVQTINSHEKLARALRRYGDHEPCCIKGDACNCGLEQALSEAEKL